MRAPASPASNARAASSSSCWIWISAPQPQRLSLNVTLWPKVAELQDDIANTVNYSAVAEWVKEFVRRRDYKLIETLAEEVAAHLLAQFDLRKVEVEVRKFVLPDANYVSVTAVREREAT